MHAGALWSPDIRQTVGKSSTETDKKRAYLVRKKRPARTGSVRTGRPVNCVSVLSTGEQPVDRGVHVQVVGLPAPRHHHIGAPEEPDEDAAWYFEQRVAVG